MAEILVTDNLIDKNWTFEGAEFEEGYVDIRFGFTDAIPRMPFSNLKFGFSVETAAGEVLVEKQYPPEGVIYVRTDQVFITSDRFAGEPGQAYILTAWAENAGERFEGSHTFAFVEQESEEPTNA